MDYDGQNQHAVTHLGTISLSPRVSPDNSRIAFASLGGNGAGKFACTRWTWDAW
jgi:TolB protein